MDLVRTRLFRHVAIVLLTCFSFSAVAISQMSGASSEDTLPSVPADQARQNLIVFVQPDYPPLAKAARIAGIVHASIDIDENGSVKNLKLISGHPMLAPAALVAIRKWKYKPFEVGGKPAAVRTEVHVSIPENINQSDIDKERKFQDAFWPNERAGREALKNGDLSTAETKFSLARSAAEERGDEKWLELADTLSEIAALRVAQNNLAEAVQLYRQSLAVHLKHQRPDEAEVAGTEESLGILYLRARIPEKAEPLLLQSANSYEARIQEISMPEAKSSYGQSLALDYFGLSQIAVASGRAEESVAWCAKAVSYAEKWSRPADKDVIIQRCGSSSQSK